MNLGEKISTVWAYVTQPNALIATIVSILVFTVLYYYMIKFLMDNDSGSLVMLFIFVMLISAAILTFIEGLNSVIYLLIPAMFIIAMLVLYSVEIKRLIWARKNMKLIDIKHDGVGYDQEKIQGCITEIIKALQNMSKNDVGAIIVLSAGNFPGQILDSGVHLDSDISSELIESVFFPKTPLHDGAMIISGTKIVAAGCFLPLSHNVDNIPKDLGTRHRAGIGVTETIDVISFIVSEETGIISVAREGKITRYADSEVLRKTLTKYYWQELESARK
ncbi:MAG: diadenylate cyclase [Clostridia bacterium]|nr:diadenylate cyclase [Clostridia bacterium]